jgi:hypothetical protein
LDFVLGFAVVFALVFALVFAAVALFFFVVTASLRAAAFFAVVFLRIAIVTRERKLESRRKKGRTMQAASSDLYHIRGLRTLLALDYLKLDLVTLCERLEAFRVDCAVMNEHVRPAFARDESKAFSVVEPLHTSLDSFHARVLLPKAFRGKFCAPLCGASDVARDSAAFDAAECHV